jgi:hypothetical protein
MEIEILHFNYSRFKVLKNNLQNFFESQKMSVFFSVLSINVYCYYWSNERMQHWSNERMQHCSFKETQVRAFCSHSAQKNKKSKSQKFETHWKKPALEKMAYQVTQT